MATAQVAPLAKPLTSEYDTYQKSVPNFQFRMRMGLTTNCSPLNSRYCSSEMKYIFSPRNRFSTWRALWIHLAESERELGLEISDTAIEQLRQRARIEDDEFEVAAIEEKRRRHDVMAHVHAYGLVAPAAAGIIHWGATSW